MGDLVCTWEDSSRGTASRGDDADGGSWGGWPPSAAIEAARIARRSRAVEVMVDTMVGYGMELLPRAFLVRLAERMLDRLQTARFSLIDEPVLPADHPLRYARGGAA